MRDGGDDVPPIPPVAGTAAVDDRVLDTPNCPSCLLRMEAAEARDGRPYWLCTSCGQVVLA
jgi:ribosomal protein L37AE/L43A